MKEKCGIGFKTEITLKRGDNILLNRKYPKEKSIMEMEQELIQKLNERLGDYSCN